MHRFSSVTAAFAAGKLPSQQQINDFIDYLAQSPILVNDPNTTGQLSTQGKLLQQDILHVLITYKQLGDAQNGMSRSFRVVIHHSLHAYSFSADNKVQDALWHLTEADISSASLSTDITSGTNNDQASKDAQVIARSIRPASLVDFSWVNVL